MGNNHKYDANVQPIVTFIVIITLGVIFGVYINNDLRLRLTIIIGSFILGAIVMIYQLRSIMNQSKEKGYYRKPKASREERIARYVSDLFDEDIQFDADSSSFDVQNDENENKL